MILPNLLYNWMSRNKWATKLVLYKINRLGDIWEFV
jgi:hypothetical protein